MKKADKILILAVITAAIVVLGFRRITRSPGERVIVRVDGQVTENWSLKEDREAVIEGKGGRNTLVISGGTASVTEADCPDRICVHERPIRYSGETIVCLPHRVVVTVTGGTEEALDGVVQ